MTAGAIRAQRGGERLAESPAGRTDLFVGIARSNLEREVEGGVLGEQHEQVIEHRDAGCDVRIAASDDSDPDLCPRLGCSGRHRLSVPE